MSSFLYLTQLLSHCGSHCNWDNKLCHWSVVTVPGRIINRMYPKKLLVLVCAKKNRWYHRGCLGRPLGQLKLSEDCDSRLMMRNVMSFGSGTTRKWVQRNEMKLGAKSR